MVKPDETDRSATSKKNNTGQHTNQIGHFKPGLWSPSQCKFESLQPEPEIWDVIAQHWFVGQVS